MHDTPQGDPMIGEHMRVIFEVLTQLRIRGVFQPVPELVQHMVARQLLGRAGITMMHWDISSDTGFDGE